MSSPQARVPSLLPALNPEFERTNAPDRAQCDRAHRLARALLFVPEPAAALTLPGPGQCIGWHRAWADARSRGLSVCHADDGHFDDGHADHGHGGIPAFCMARPKQLFGGILARAALVGTRLA
jgi:hypothetical protein